MAQKKSTPLKSPAGKRRASQAKADASVSRGSQPAPATSRKSSRQSPSKSAAKEKRAQSQEAGKESFPVVGIGASAGGLEAFRELLEHLPVDTGMAFVLVSHLDPTHKSILTELLARRTRLPVSEVSDGMRVAPDHVYVMPPNTSMGIAEGVLRLRPREEGRAGRHPVDAFLRSLAEDQSHRAIGVILSGTDSDGTLGLEAIKAEGGITFAQEPQSAKYDGMPRSAVAAGVVDFILTPEGIAQELARISRHPYVSPPAATPDDAERQPTGRNGFRKILALLHKAKGVDFTDYKANTLHRRITRRMVLNKLESMDGYARHLRENAEEVEALYQDILINVTSFFRNPEAFALLKERIFPQVARQRTPDEPLRIWTLGCSSGEEAYSIAMSFTEFAEGHKEHLPIQIFATDLSDRGIEKARAGLYSKDITEDVSAERLRRFFTEADGGYRISKPIRDMVVFARQNVIADPPFSRLDLISCRNLLIYLEPVLQKQVLPTLHYALKPTGVLWLGTSETPGSSSDLFAPEDKKHRFYSKKPASTRWHFQSALGDAARQSAGAGQKPNLLSEQLRTEHDAQKEADRILLARYSPAGVVINSEMEILQFRGSTGAYLEPPAGKATLNLLKMAREGLMLPLRVAVQKAKKDNQTIRKEGVRVNYDGESRRINLEVIPVTGLAAHERCFLVLFEPVSQPAATEPGTPATRKAKTSKAKRETEDRQTARLQEELSVTREYMQSLVEQHEAANEELQSANEEIQSSNEELQSINEELETSKEELESSNEELATLNDELHNRNQELTTLNNDLSNLHVSVNIPILFLGRDLRIRRFTPQAEKVLSLIATDVGRPVGDIKLKINVPDLEALIVEVIETVSVKEREVQDTEGCWYAMRVRPYKTLDNKIDGAVVVLVDIDALKQSAGTLRESEERFRTLVEQVKEYAIFRTDTSGRATTWNEGVKRILGFDEAEFIGQDVVTAIFTPEDVESGVADKELETAAAKGSASNDRWMQRKDGTRFYASGITTGLKNESGTVIGFSKVLRDTTEHKQAEVALRASEDRYRILFGSVPVAVFVCDRNAVIQGYNRRAVELWGREPTCGVEQHCGSAKLWLPDGALLPHAQSPMVEVLRTGIPATNVEVFIERPDGSRIPVIVNFAALKDARGEITGAITSFMDITERKATEVLVDSQRQALQLLADGAPLDDVLGFLIGVVERHSAEGMLASIAPLNEAGTHFQRGIGASLPDAFNAAIEGVAVSSPTGLCATAVRRHEAVAVHDFSADTAWQPFGEFVAPYGLRSGWSMPIISASGQILGTFANYYRHAGDPTPQNRELVDMVVRTAAIAIERKRAEEALREAAARFRFMAESMPQKMFTALPNGEVDYFNQQWTEFTGLSFEQIRDWGWTQFIHPDDVAENVRVWQHSIDTGEEFEFEHRFRRADGEYCWHLSRAHAMRDAEGNVLMWIGSNTDIDDVKRTEEALLEGAHLAALGADVGAALTQSETLREMLRRCAETLVEHLDAAFARIWTLNEAENVLEQQASAGMYTHLDGAHSRVPVGKFKIGLIAEERAPHLTNDVRHDPRISDGDWAEREGMIAFAGYPLLVEDRLVGVMALFARRPLTKDTLDALAAVANSIALGIERKRAEEERERLLAREQHARAEADEANRLKDEFLATVSHELRTPLTAIMGWANMLQGGRLEAQTAARAVETIARNAHAQNQIITDLLDVSRIISGKLRFEVGAVDLSAVIEAAMDAVRPAAEAKGIELRALLDRVAGLVSGDAGRLQQVVWNLLTNAVKYTPKGGHIEARLERADSSVTISVRDTGEGLSPEILPYIFDRFRQADGTTTRRHGGLGLGLAIVRQLVEAHGGTVRAASHGAGQGATFTVTLPLIAVRREESGAERADAGETPSARAPAPQSLHGLRVLVVDDEPDARELLTLALTQAGAEVRVVATVRAALDMLEQWTPDVLVSDIGMPGEDGYDLIREVRAHGPERGRLLPALALTGYAGADDTKRALTAGFQLHVPKPVELNKLVEAVASLAGRDGRV